MKKLGIFLMLLLLLSLPALAEEAQDITPQCSITVSNNAKNLSLMFDDSYETYWSSNHRGFVEITAPAEQPIYGLYVSWGQFITTWCVQAYDAARSAWYDVYTTEDAFYNQYIPLPEGYTALRLTCQSPDFEHVMHVSKLHVLSSGDVPAWVQQWKTFEGKADLVLMVTDPGDEFLFFGGLVPYYVAQGREVMVCVIVNTGAVYKSQMLDGLWHCGLTNYPYIAYFKPNMATTARAQYSIWSEVQFVRHVSRIVRIYKPDVFVTHAHDGEGIDGGHKVCADAAIRSLTAAMDAKYDIGYGYTLYGNWQPKKLYLHLYGEQCTTLDYSQPLAYFGGKSAWELAEEAYAMQDYQDKYSPVLRTDGVFDTTAFGLYFSSVGEDTGIGDLFEHID